MSQEKVLKTLESLGLERSDAQVYVFLGKRGPQKGKDIAKALKMPKQHLYLILKNLQSKGIVNATLERPARFSALPFEKTLDLFVKAKMEEAQRIDHGKDEILSDWKSISIHEAADQSPRFTVIEGRKYIYPRLKQMIEEAKSQLSIISSVPGLVRADQAGILDAALKHASKTSTKFRLLTELSDENLTAVKLLIEKMPKGSNFEGRTPELGVKLISRMLIRDDSEAAFFVGQDTNGSASEADDVCLWTNSKTIANSFKAIFEDLWHSSTSIEKRIIEIETGKPTAKTCVISDPEAAKSKYDDVMKAAQTEIVMITSAAGLGEAQKNISRFKEKGEKGVSVRIMAPITRDNLEAALRLSVCCKVRHVPASYLGNTIIDGKHLFQFKNYPSSDREKQDGITSFENIFYTNDSEYVEETKSMLDEVWKHAIAPSLVTLEQITKPPIPTLAPVPDDECTVSQKDSVYQKMRMGIEEKPGMVTEEYVLNKLINAQRTTVKDPTKDPSRFYGSTATAAIRPPSNFNLPDMILTFFHFNKQSSWGAEDRMIVYLWLETPEGKAFVPAALAGDNPKGVKRSNHCLAGTPASQNQHVLKKDELQIQVHGNTLFAGWTVPIPLFPPQYCLPPGAILFEGYGKVKPLVNTYTLPSGTVIIHEANGLEAFATFFHPASKYAGSGTDGTMARDLIMTVYPPIPPKPVKCSKRQTTGNSA